MATVLSFGTKGYGLVGAKTHLEFVPNISEGICLHRRNDVFAQRFIPSFRQFDPAVVSLNGAATLL
jgi:hypothetical protein